MLCTPDWMRERLAQTERLWLFLDYDGTLAELAPTPDHIESDPELIELLDRLAQNRYIRVTVVSGRRLVHVQELLPVSGILLAGTYGVELRTAAGERKDRIDYQDIRPALESLKPRWSELIAEREGFFLEDKGWSLALHARFAEDEEAEKVLEIAHEMASDAASSGPFRLLGGHKFFEIGPQLANKGKTITYLLKQHPWPDAVLLYLGDDDKDEEAFEVIKAQDGMAIVVAREPRETLADCRLESPDAVRRWLTELLARFEDQGSTSRD